MTDTPTSELPTDAMGPDDEALLVQTVFPPDDLPDPEQTPEDLGVGK